VTDTLDTLQATILDRRDHPRPTRRWDILVCRQDDWRLLPPVLRRADAEPPKRDVLCLASSCPRRRVSRLQALPS